MGTLHPSGGKIEDPLGPPCKYISETYRSINVGKYCRLMSSRWGPSVWPGEGSFNLDQINKALYQCHLYKNTAEMRKFELILTIFKTEAEKQKLELKCKSLQEEVKNKTELRDLKKSDTSAVAKPAEDNSSSDFHLEQRSHRPTADKRCPPTTVDSRSLQPSTATVWPLPVTNGLESTIGPQLSEAPCCPTEAVTSSLPKKPGVTESKPRNDGHSAVKQRDKPWTPMEMMKIVESLPCLANGIAPLQAALRRCVICFGCNVTDFLSLLRAHLTPQEYTKFEEKAAPTPNAQNQAYELDRLINILTEVFCDWSKIATCLQRKDEPVVDFCNRFANIFWDNYGSPQLWDFFLPLVITFCLRNMLPQLQSSLESLIDGNPGIAWSSFVGEAVKTERSLQATSQTRAVSLASGKPRRAKGNCYYCGKAGHWANVCRKKQRDWAYHQASERNLLALPWRS